MIHRLIPAILLLALAACTAPTAPGIKLILPSPTLSLLQGHNGEPQPLTLERLGGLQGAVSLTLEDAPTGVEGRFSPNPVLANGSELILRIDPEAPTGRHNLKIRAIAQGVSQVLPLTLEIGEGGKFQLGLDSPSVRLLQGRSLRLPVSVQRNEVLQGPIQFRLRGAGNTEPPLGVSGSFDGETLNLEAAASLAAGTYGLEVRGEAAGLSRSVPLQLTVEDAPAYGLGLLPANLSLRQNQNGASSVSITRTKGFAENVALSVVQTNGSPLPTGITAGFSPVSTTGNGSVLTLTVAPDVEPRDYALQLRGASSSLSQRRDFTLSVLPRTDFTLRFNPADQSVRQGEEAEVRFEQGAVGGFTGSVGLSLEAPPGSGIVASMGSRETSGGVVRVQVPLETPVGRYTVLLRGVAGALMRTAELTLNVTEASGFRLVPATQSVTVLRGQTTSVDVAIERLNGMGSDEPIYFDLWNATSPQPTSLSEVRYGFDPSPASGGSVRVNLDTSWFSRPPTTYVIEVRGVTGGINTRRAVARFNLSVIDPPSFTLSASSSSLALNPGQGLPVSVRVIPQNGFTGSVEFSLVKPANLATLFSEQFSPTSGSSTILTLTASGTVAPGYYNGMQVRAVSGGLSATLDLAVAVRSPSGTAVSIRTLAATTPTNPTWAAFQDGIGPWQTLTASGGAYNFTVSDPSRRFGFVAVCPPAPNGLRLVKVLYLSASETSSLDLPCDSRAPNRNALGNLGRVRTGDSQLTGSVSGLSAAAPSAFVQSPNNSAEATLASPGYTLQWLPQETLNILATRRLSTGLADRLLVVRGVNLRTTSSLNLDLAVGLPLSGSHTVTLTNPRSDAVLGAAAVLAGLGDDFSSGAALSPPPAVIGAVSTTYAGLTTPASDILHIALAQRRDRFDGESMVLRLDRTAGSRNITLPALASMTYDPLEGNYRRWRVRFPCPAVCQIHWAHFTQPAIAPRSSGLVWSLFISPGWLSQAINRSADLPDLSGLTGWQDGWGLLSGFGGEVALGYWNSNRSLAYLLSLDYPTINSAIQSQLDGLELGISTNSRSFQ